MKKIAFAVMYLIVSSVSPAAPPTEDMVKSCLRAQPVAPSITFRTLDAHTIASEDNYAGSFDASYLVKYRGTDAGYAESKTDQALIYLGKIYRLSKAIPLGRNGGVKSGSFDPTLAQWGVVTELSSNYLCVSFDFDGLGRSGVFQNIRGGYLLNEKTRLLYFAVRDIRK